MGCPRGVGVSHQARGGGWRRIRLELWQAGSCERYKLATTRHIIGAGWPSRHLLTLGPSLE